MSFSEKIINFLGVNTEYRRIAEKGRLAERIAKITEDFAQTLRDNASFHDLCAQEDIPVEKMIPKFLTHGKQPNGIRYITLGRNHYMRPAFEILISPNGEEVVMSTPFEPSKSIPLVDERRLESGASEIMRVIAAYDFNKNKASRTIEEAA